MSKYVSGWKCGGVVSLSRDTHSTLIPKHIWTYLEYFLLRIAWLGRLMIFNRISSLQKLLPLRGSHYFDNNNKFINTADICH